jgi:tetratricopeptide (TPR) repeat protein
MRELETYCARTGRAFQPRLDLAAWHREHDRREAEVRLLEQAARIDPFMRELHERLADALVALGKRERAVEALQVALAVRPAIDRAWLDRQDEVPDADAPAEREARAGICVRLAELLRSLRRDQEAYAMLKRARTEAPDSDAARRAAELEREWAK